MGKSNSILDAKFIHFVGVGGIGMSGVARLLLEMGYNVSGSDLESNNLTKNLELMGGRIFEGHRSTNLPKDDHVLVYSSSISGDNPELKAARRRKVRIAHRAEILGEIFNERKGIAVTGMHGKTTTTSLVSVMLEKAGLDPTVVIGGEISAFCGNAHLGKGDYFVAEADESDSSFLYMKPYYAVITNIDMEHLDHYHGLDNIKKSFRSFIGNVKEGGLVIYNINNKATKELMKGFDGASATFGYSKDADIYPHDIRLDGFKSSFECIYKGKTLGTVKLSIPGEYNVLNALAAILVGLELGLDFKDIKEGIKSFTGAKRRFQLRSNSGGIMLIEDYAHHPTEIKAVLNACRNWKNKRLIAIFQPHRYTRTKFLADDFGKCFRLADRLILTDIYAASERPIKDISIKTIYDRVVACGALQDVEIVKKKDIARHVMDLSRRGDMIVVMGAGDINKVADELCTKLGAGDAGIENYIEELKGLVKGKVKLRENLSQHTTLRIGGPTDVWVEPRDTGDLKASLVFAKRRKIPFFVIGNGSNILVNDSGFRGIVISLCSPFFKRARIKGRTISVGAGYSLPKLVRSSCENGLSGLESLVGIPGTIGGAIYMNAGGYTNPIFKNMGDLVISLEVMDHNGKIKNIEKSEINFGYRFSNLDPYVILEARLAFEKRDKISLLSSCSQFLKMKKAKQVLDMPSAGCLFKNPPDFQFTCGQMIDMLGLKGKRIGGAEVSEKHANFIINRGMATCKNVLAMASFIKKKVKENYAITLNMEIKVI